MAVVAVPPPWPQVRPEHQLGVLPLCLHSGCTSCSHALHEEPTVGGYGAKSVSLMYMYALPAFSPPSPTHRQSSSPTRASSTFVVASHEERRCLPRHCLPSQAHSGFESQLLNWSSVHAFSSEVPAQAAASFV